MRLWQKLAIATSCVPFTVMTHAWAMFHYVSQLGFSPEERSYVWFVTGCIDILAAIVVGVLYIGNDGKEPK